MTSKKVSIGVVCEGQTDYVAICSFLGQALVKREIEPKFIALQPQPGNSDDAGWTRVFFWLEQNPPEARIRTYFGGGLFENDLGSEKCDVLLFQMDSDILDDGTFSGYMKNRAINYSIPANPVDRGKEICRLLSLFSRFEELVAADMSRHIFAPAVESTETWCVAAFKKLATDPELLRGQELWDAFTDCLLRSEGRNPNPPFGTPDKDVKRRSEYCTRHANSVFIEPQSLHFRLAADTIALNAK